MMKTGFMVLFGVAVSLSGLVGGAEALKFRTPLVTDLYTADPSAHVFEGKVYIYPSHDLDTNTPSSDDADQFDMADYRVYSMANMVGAPVVDHGEVLHLKDVPWASKQLWAPDAAFRNGRYYLFFPARDKSNIFRIGVATSDKPSGPFKAEPKPLDGSFSIDPAVFIDDDNKAYLFLGGLWGGQLEKWRTGTFDPKGACPPADQPALGPRVARLSDDLLSLAGPAAEISIRDENGKPITSGDNKRRFFEGIWVHKFNKTYYLTYSTGDTHYLVWATSDKPEGPYTYRGKLLEPVRGWTTHHSIVQVEGKWYLFYHDNSLSKNDHKRCIKVIGFERTADGGLPLLTP